MLQHFAAFIQHQPSAGLLVVPQPLPYAIAVKELLLIWAASEAKAWINRIAYLPLNRLGQGLLSRVHLSPDIVLVTVDGQRFRHTQP
jgi:hypothetical protein